MIFHNELKKEVLSEEFGKALASFQTVLTFQQKLTPEEIASAFAVTKSKHPELFWTVGYSVKSGRNFTELEFQVMNHYTVNQLKTMTSAMNRKARSIAQKAMKHHSAYDKILSVHDEIVSFTEYSKTRSNSKNLSHTAYGCLVEKKAVCEGYARAFQYVMQILRIECGICSGTVGSESHAWNYVKIGNAYYWIDVTWDDPVCKTKSEFKDWISHSYFLLNDETLFRTRKLSKDNVFVPACREMKENFFVKNQLYFKTYDFLQVDRLLTAHLKEKRLEIMFSSPKEIQKAVRDLFEKKTFWQAKIFDAPNGRKGGSVKYEVNDELAVLRILFQIK